MTDISVTIILGKNKHSEISNLYLKFVATSSNLAINKLLFRLVHLFLRWYDTCREN